MKFYNLNYLLTFLVVLIVSCNQGLEPPGQNRTILAGNVIVENGTYPDSVTALRVAAFQISEVDSISKFIGEIIAGNALITDNLLNENSDSLLIPFKFEVEETPITFNYNIAAVQITDDLTRQTVIGIYQENGEQGAITLNRNDSVFIEIKVDFDNLPEQPQ